MIKKIPFKINYPLKIFKQKKIDMNLDWERDNIFKRNIYYYNFDNEINKILEDRRILFMELTKRVLVFLKEKYPHLEPMNVSVFGSSLFSINPEDFDFLVIVEGNRFLLEETAFELGGKDIKVGISIKGVENFSKGCSDPNANVPIGKQMEIVHRTAVSLFRRHLPVWGHDFVNNEDAFLSNIPAQVSDLLCNSYEMYYGDESIEGLNPQQRSKKILSRVYEALSYLTLLEKDKEISEFRKRVYLAIISQTGIEESKRILEELIRIYQKRLKIRDISNSEGSKW